LKDIGFAVFWHDTTNYFRLFLFKPELFFALFMIAIGKNY